jgi:tRNA(Arg) A34 adenosine deaminase TadA
MCQVLCPPSPVPTPHPMNFPTFSFQLPAWLAGFLPPAETVYATAEARMKLVIDLAKQNIAHATGGPFGAAVFNMATGQLVAPGVNLVVPHNCAILHAEMVAITIAQQVLGHYDLGADGLPPCELVTSTEPCAMCFGAVPWSGVRRLVCGARDEDARAIGFDEGPKLLDWADHLTLRGIEVVRDVCRQEAAAVLQQYMATAGHIYNARQGDL